MKDLTDVLADWLSEADVLERRGHAHDAKLVRDVVHAVQESAADFVTWLSEEQALLRSGRSRPFLRQHFPAWQQDGLAKLDGRRRRYRQCIIPRRANIDAAREAGRTAAREASA